MKPKELMELKKYYRKKVKRTFKMAYLGLYAVQYHFFPMFFVFIFLIIVIPSIVTLMVGQFLYGWIIFLHLGWQLFIAYQFGKRLGKNENIEGKKPPKFVLYPFLLLSMFTTVPLFSEYHFFYEHGGCRVDGGHTLIRCQEYAETLITIGRVEAGKKLLLADCRNTAYSCDSYEKKYVGPELINRIEFKEYTCFTFNDWVQCRDLLELYGSNSSYSENIVKAILSPAIISPRELSFSKAVSAMKLPNPPFEKYLLNLGCYKYNEAKSCTKLAGRYKFPSIERIKYLKRACKIGKETRRYKPCESLKRTEEFYKTARLSGNSLDFGKIYKQCTENTGSKISVYCDDLRIHFKKINYKKGLITLDKKICERGDVSRCGRDSNHGRKFLKKHCYAGNKEACTRLGVHYLHRKEQKENRSLNEENHYKAIKFLGMGCKLGDVRGCEGYLSFNFYSRKHSKKLIMIAFKKYCIQDEEYIRYNCSNHFSRYRHILTTQQLKKLCGLKSKVFKDEDVCRPSR